MDQWLDVAKGELGVAEIAGKVAKPRILEYFAAAGHGEIKSDETAWCSAFVNFCMEQAGVRGTMSLAARSWLRWGKPCSPQPGAIGIWPRGKSTWQGHVAIVEEVIGDKVVCIGGNQSNSVCRRAFPIDTALGFRWPSTMANSRTAKAALAGTTATGATFLLDQAQQARDLAGDLQQYVTWATYGVIALSILCFVVVAYYRWQDLQEKGR